MKRIGIVDWTQGDGVALLHQKIVGNLGYEPAIFHFQSKLPEGLDAILLYGPWGSMAPLINQLVAFPEESRPG